MEYADYDWERPGPHWIVFNFLVLGVLLYLGRRKVAQAGVTFVASSFRVFMPPVLGTVFILGYMSLKSNVAEVVGQEHLDAVMWVIGLGTIVFAYRLVFYRQR